MTTAEHLKPIEPAAAVYDVCQAIRRASVAQYGVLLELQAFEETRTPHDGKRLANALLHVINRPDLAEMVETLLFMAGEAWTPEQTEAMRQRRVSVTFDPLAPPGQRIKSVVEYTHGMNVLTDAGKLSENRTVSDRARLIADLRAVVEHPENFPAEARNAYMRELCKRALAALIEERCPHCGEETVALCGKDVCEWSN